jgi:hypothetical protein
LRGRKSKRRLNPGRCVPELIALSRRGCGTRRPRRRGPAQDLLVGTRHRACRRSRPGSSPRISSTPISGPCQIEATPAPGGGIGQLARGGRVSSHSSSFIPHPSSLPLAVCGNRQVTGTHTQGAGQAGFRLVSPFPGSAPGFSPDTQEIGKCPDFFPPALAAAVLLMLILLLVIRTSCPGIARYSRHVPLLRVHRVWLAAGPVLSHRQVVTEKGTGVKRSHFARPSTVTISSSVRP